MREAVEELVADGVEALTVCLLNAHANGRHERVIAEIAASVAPDLPVSISSEILPEFREYERTVTTLMNAYVAPVLEKYLTNVRDGLAAADVRRAAPGRALRRRADEPRVGVQERRADRALGPGRRRQRRVVRRLARGLRPHPDLRHGRHVDRRRRLRRRAGRRSRARRRSATSPCAPRPSTSRASAPAAARSPTSPRRPGRCGSARRAPAPFPGPACYGRGGTAATVTDANVVLGHLPPRLLGGEFELDVGRRLQRRRAGRRGARRRRRGDRARDREHGRRGDARRAPRRHRAARPRAERVRARRLRRRGRPARERARARSSAATR